MLIFSTFSPVLLHWWLHIFKESTFTLKRLSRLYTLKCRDVSNNCFNTKLIRSLCAEHFGNISGLTVSFHWFNPSCIHTEASE